MERIGDISKDVAKGLALPEPEIRTGKVERMAAPASADPLADIVNQIFRQLCGIFTGWRHTWPKPADLNAAKREYYKALRAEGIQHFEQVHFGLEACRKLDTDFPPSAGRFLALCVPTPQDMGLLHPLNAYREAMQLTYLGAQGEWSSPVVMEAALECGFRWLQNAPEDKGTARFFEAYSKACHRYAMGLPMRPIPKGLLPDPKSEIHKSSAEVKAKYIADIRASLGKRRG
jgi:hypothetical protein